ncbi:MAG: YlqD family protein [Peptococcaceae bacterium]|nr:YlqD family protein [Peptococcaceae bacterium]
MEELQLLGKVYFKQIVTEGYKKKTAADIQTQIDEIDAQLEEYDKQMSKTMTELTLKAHPQTEAVRAQLNAERDKIAVYKEQFTRALAAVDDLVDGTEVDAGDGEFVTTVKVGDTFSALTKVELVVEDDVVKEIRTK